MLNINFNTDMSIEQHKCESVREGDWIVFSCPRCPEFERRINWRTGDMKSRAAKAEVSHSGNYAPHEFRNAFLDVN